jgi:hypothetical protein
VQQCHPSGGQRTSCCVVSRLDLAGCVEAQGFLFSAARPAAKIPLLLQMINGTPLAAVA